MSKVLPLRSCLVSLVFAAVGASAADAQAHRPPRVSPDRIDSIVEAHRAEYHVPAVALFIGTTSGRRLYEKSYGTVRTAPKIPAKPSSLFLLASVSKPYAAVAAHRLTEDHRLDLSAPISRYLRGLPPWSDSVSVRQLLAHSSGIRDFTDVKGWNDTASADAYIARALAEPLRFSPGTQTEYSNTNYALVQRIIEQITGDSYAATATRLVLTPLGLAHTHFDCPRSSASQLAQGYRLGRSGESVPVSPPGREHYPDATAGLCASAADAGRFFSAIVTGRLLGIRSMEDLHTAIEGEPEDAHFGAGLEVTHETTGEVWSHSGAIPGGNTEVAIWPKDSLVIVILTNLGGAGAEQLSRQIVHSLLGVTPTPVSDLPLDSGSVARYAGRYDLANGRLIVGERDGHLTVIGERCYYQGSDVFVCDPDKSRTIRFVRDTAGAQEAWLFIEGVRRIRARRAQVPTGGGNTATVTSNERCNCQRMAIVVFAAARQTLI